jgi:hypothetical protein
LIQVEPAIFKRRGRASPPASPAPRKAPTAAVPRRAKPSHLSIRVPHPIPPPPVVADDVRRNLAAALEDNGRVVLALPPPSAPAAPDTSAISRRIDQVPVFLPFSSIAAGA